MSKAMTSIIALSWAICSAHAAAQAAPQAALPEEQAERPGASTTTADTQDGVVNEQVGLGDIIVTAQRRSESLQDVPIAISVIGGERLDTGAALDVADLNSLAPGLNVTSSGGSQVLPRIRGIGITAASAGLENPVAVYVDDVYYASPRGSQLSLNDVEQIAVLKGPQGTLFGRNATGGVIQITTREPTQDFRFSAEVGYGNNDTMSAGAYVAGGVTSTVAASLSIDYHNQMDGFGINLFNGEDVNDSKDFTVRSKLRFRPSENTDIRLSADYANNSASLPANRLIDGAIGTGGFRFVGGRYDVNSNTQPFYKTRQGGVSLKAERTWDFATLTSITAYRDAWSTNTLDADYSPAPSVAVSNIVKDKQFSQELRLGSRRPDSFSWTVGAFYFSSTGSNDPVSVTVAGGNVTNLTLSEQKTRSMAIFGQSSYEVANRLTLTAGLRYTIDRQSLAGQTIRQTATTSTQTGSDSDSSEFARLTWRFAVDYRINSNILVYALHSRGSKSAGYNSQALPAVSFEPETLDDYEVGLKTDLLDRRLRINLAAFYYDYRDLQVSSYPFGILTIANAANAELYGADIDIDAAVTSRLTMTAGISLLHARYKDFTKAPITTPSPTGGNIIAPGDASGQHVTVSPELTATAAVNYRIPLGDDSLTLSADYYHNSGWYPTPDNRFKQPSYDLVSASATFAFHNDLYRLRLWGRNLFNEGYAAQYSVGGNGDAISYAPGRSFGATFSADFW